MKQKKPKGTAVGKDYIDMLTRQSEDASCAASFADVLPYSCAYELPFQPGAACGVRT